MTIRIFPSKLTGEPLEQHPLGPAPTFEAWLVANVPSYDPSRLVISADLNGLWFDPATWGTLQLTATDRIDIYPEAKGKVVNTVLNVATLGAWSLVMKLIMPQVATPSTASTATGDDLSESSIKGNKVKLNDVVREAFGTRRIYPDYLLPLRRYFADYREQWTEMLLCVGVGEFDIPQGLIKVGDTSMLSLGSDAEFAVYGPGADLSAEPAATWWHSASEVGATSTGTAGLELTVATTITPNASVNTLTFSGYEISAATAGERFPESWTAGLTLRVIAPYSYSVQANGRVWGSPLQMLAPEVGQQVEIFGSQNSGYYYIGNVHEDVGGDVDYIDLVDANGNPVNMAIGDQTFAIGPVGLLFRIASTNYDEDADTSTADTQGPTVLDVVRLLANGEVDDSFPGFDALNTTSGSATIDASSLVGGNRGPFAACPVNEVCTQIQWDVFFPQGLCGAGREGQIYAINAYHILEYRDMAIGGAWTSLEYSHRGQTLDAGGFTNTLTLPYPMRPEVRIRKKFVRQGGASTSEYHDTTQWYGLRANIPVKKAYEGVTTIAIRVRGGDRLASQSEQLINLVPTRRLPYRLNGAWHAADGTRAIEAAAAYIAKSVGYTDAQLDLIEFDRLAAVWRSRGDWYDDLYTSQTTVKDAINRALQAGFSELTLDSGQIRPVRDEPRSTIQHMYTPQNMTEQLTRSVTMVTPDDYDGVDVKYTNARTWQTETVECRLPGDEGAIVETIELDGVTDRDRAWRIGMRRRRSQIYRRWTYTWSTELDGLNSRYLDYCAVADDVPGYAQSALLLGYVEGNGLLLLESSEPLDWSSAGTHVVAVRRPDGTLSGPWTATRVDDYRMTIPDTLDFEPDVSWDIEPPHLLFGPATRWSYPVLVTAVTPDSTDGVKMEAMSYDDRVYLSDDGFAP